VYDRKKTRQGEYFVCRVPDSTTLAVPAWMLNPECAQFSLGPPLVAVEALLELRDLLTTLRLPADCDKASLKSSLQEEAHEATREAPSRQFNLPLLVLPALAVPKQKQRELALALMELLIDAARPHAEFQVNGGGDEPEANR